MNYIKIFKKGLFRTASDGQVGEKVGKGLTFDNYGGSTSIVRRVGVAGFVAVNVLSLVLAPAGLFGPVKMEEA